MNRFVLAMTLLFLFPSIAWAKGPIPVEISGPEMIGSVVIGESLTSVNDKEYWDFVASIGFFELMGLAPHEPIAGEVRVEGEPIVATFRWFTGAEIPLHLYLQSNLGPVVYLEPGIVKTRGAPDYRVSGGWFDAPGSLEAQLEAYGVVPGGSGTHQTQPWVLPVVLLALLGVAVATGSRVGLQVTPQSV